jgi:hypothetical protein
MSTKIDNIKFKYNEIKFKLNCNEFRPNKIHVQSKLNIRLEDCFVIY